MAFQAFSVKNLLVVLLITVSSIIALLALESIPL